MDRKEHLRGLLSNTEALTEAMRYSVSSTTGIGPGEIWRFASYKTFMRKFIALLEQAAPLLANPNGLDTYNLEYVPESHKTTWVQQRCGLDRPVRISKLENV